jgi:hypothetical protein
MASGYEKHECGVDPNKGWDLSRPFRLSDILIAVLAWVLAAVSTVATVLSLLRLFVG